MPVSRIVCEWKHDAYSVVAPLRPWRGGIVIFVAGALAAVGLAALGVLALQGPHADRTGAFVFLVAGSVTGYVAALIAFEKTSAVVGASKVEVRRGPLPMLPTVRHFGVVDGIALPQVIGYTRSGGTYTLYPVVATFRDRKHVTILENAGDAVTAKAVAGKIAGGLGITIVSGAAGGPVNAERRAKIVLVLTASIVFLVIAGFSAAAIVAPHRFGL